MGVAALNLRCHQWVGGLKLLGDPDDFRGCTVAAGSGLCAGAGGRYSPKQVPDARSMALSGGGNGGATILYVGNRAGNNVKLRVPVSYVPARYHPRGTDWRAGPRLLRQWQRGAPKSPPHTFVRTVILQEQLPTSASGYANQRQVQLALFTKHSPKLFLRRRHSLEQ